MMRQFYIREIMKGHVSTHLRTDGDAARVSGIKFLNKQRAVLDRAHQDVRGVKRGLQRQARRNNERRLTGNCAGGLIAMK